MKRFIIYSLWLCMTCVACSDDNGGDTPITPPSPEPTDELAFDLNEKNPYRIEQTPFGYRVLFNFTENADSIMCYTGDAGHIYDLREGTPMEIDALNFSFKANCSYQNAQPAQAPNEQVQVMVSTDYMGDTDKESIYAANWTDISSSFALPTSLNSTYVESGLVDIKNLIGKHESIYIAFKYTTKDQTTYGGYSTVNIENYVLNNICEGISEESPLVFNVSEYASDDAGLSGRTNINSSGRIICRGIQSGRQTTQTEAWVIADTPVSTADVLVKDTPYIIKEAGSESQTTFFHYYDSPGEYQVVFVAHNDGAAEAETIIKEITITIIDNIIIE